QNGESDNKSEKKNRCKEIALKVYLHCEGLSKLIKAEIEDNKVVVKNVELISPKPNPNQDQKESQPKKKVTSILNHLLSTPQIKTATLKCSNGGTRPIKVNGGGTRSHESSRTRGEDQEKAWETCRASKSNTQRKAKLIKTRKTITRRTKIVMETQ
ncbi:hypothetical protein HID58_053280, partial [Brassica napus]